MRGKAAGTGEASSLRTHRSSGESDEFPSEEGDDEDMASTAGKVSVSQLLLLIIHRLNVRG